MKRKVLIGYDESPQAQDALGLGHAFARALDAMALLTTVIRHPRRGVDESEFESAVTEFCRPLYETARERLQGVEVVECPVVHGSRPGAFHELLDWEKPTLIAIGSTHLAPAGRILLGSFGVSLLSGAPCPVAVAPRGYADREPRLERIGVAVDGSPEGWRGLQAGTVLAREKKAPLRVLTVMEPPHYGLGGLLSSFDAEEYRGFREREGEELLDEASRRLPSGTSAERTLLHGHPAEALAEAAQDLDLLVVGSRGYGPIQGAVLGSVSAKLMASSPCPVMVLTRGAGTRPLEQ